MTRTCFKIIVKMLPREERKRRWERYQQSLVVSYDLSEWYATFRPVERRLFFHSLWSLNEVLYDRDVVRRILEDLIWLWKRKHYSPLEGCRLYRLNETPKHFIKELVCDLTRMHHENVERSRSELEKEWGENYDSRYLEILFRSGNQFCSGSYTTKYVKKFDVWYLCEEFITVPPRISYECIDIRDREKLYRSLSYSNIDKVYDKKLMDIEIQERVNRWVDPFLQKVGKIRDFLQFDPVEMNKNFLGYS